MTPPDLQVRRRSVAPPRRGIAPEELLAAIVVGVIAVAVWPVALALTGPPPLPLTAALAHVRAFAPRASGRHTRRQRPTGHLSNLCLVLLGMASVYVKGSLDLMLMGVLRRGPAHGYAIIASLRDRSDGAFDLAEGTIYPALHRLERAGLVGSSTEVAQGRQRRTYALTERGRQEFLTQQQEWQGFVATMKAVLA